MVYPQRIPSNPVGDDPFLMAEELHISHGTFVQINDVIATLSDNYGNTKQIKARDNGYVLFIGIKKIDWVWKNDIIAILSLNPQEDIEPLLKGWVRPRYVFNSDHEESLGLLDKADPLYSFLSQFNQSFNYGKYIVKGGFGEIYQCDLICGEVPPEPLLFKKFFGPKSESSHTISKMLVQAIVGIKDELKTPIYEVKALRGLPLIPIEGIEMEKNGDKRKVYGFISRYFEPEKYSTLDKIIENEELRERFQSLPLKQRLQLCLDLVAGFEVLQHPKVGFIHADLKPQNLMINFEEPSVVIIDYDSGSVTAMGMDNPITKGDENWSHPSMRKKTTNIDDVYALATAIHYFLAPLYHPYGFLKISNEKVLKDFYFTKFEWPNYDVKYIVTVDRHRLDIFSADERFRDGNQYKQYLSELPQNILKLLTNTFGKVGFNDKNRIPSLLQWRVNLKEAIIATNIYYFDPLTDFQEFIEELRENDEKKKIIEDYEKYYPEDLKKGKSIRNQVWYKDYVSKFNVLDIAVPVSLNNDFDWKLFVQLVASSLSSVYDLGYGENPPEMKISVDDSSVIVSDLDHFQIYNLFEIYIEEQMSMQNHINSSQGEKEEVEVQRKAAIDIWKRRLGNLNIFN